MKATNTHMKRLLFFFLFFFISFFASIVLCIFGTHCGENINPFPSLSLSLSLSLTVICILYTPRYVNSCLSVFLTFFFSHLVLFILLLHTVLPLFPLFLFNRPLYLRSHNSSLAPHHQHHQVVALRKLQRLNSLSHPAQLSHLPSAPRLRSLSWAWVRVCGLQRASEAVCCVAWEALGKEEPHDA